MKTLPFALSPLSLWERGVSRKNSSLDETPPNRYTVPKTPCHSAQSSMSLSLTHTRWYYFYSYGIRNRIAVGGA